MTVLGHLATMRLAAPADNADKSAPVILPHLSGALLEDKFCHLATLVGALLPVPTLVWAARGSW